MQLLSQLQARTNWVNTSSNEVDTKTTTLSESAQESKEDSISEAGAAFGGPVTGGYIAAFHQNWEVSIPSFWSVFTHDPIFITLDVVVAFTDASFQPDYRKTDDWVWDLDVSDVLTAISPRYTNFRHIEAGIYRCVMKVVGYLLGGKRKIRFGFNFKAIWQSGSPQVTTWSSTIQAASHLLTSAVIGRQVAFSEESRPLNLTPIPPDFDLLLDDTEDNATDSLDQSGIALNSSPGRHRI